MNKNIRRVISGTLSLLLVGQIMVFGDGASQGILHADTIASAAEAIEGAKNANQLADEFEEATEGLGEVEYFGSSENEIATVSDDVDDMESDANIMPLSEDEEPEFAAELTLNGYVKKGTVSDYTASDNTPIYIRIYDGDWNEVYSWEIAENQEYTVTADYLDVYHVKYECDGYLPFYLKDFGTGSYRVGTGESTNTVTLVPGDTTYNADSDNQWSDDVINANDVAYVQSCLGAHRGNSNFNPSMDTDGNGEISEAEKNAFLQFYTDLGNEQIDISDMNANYYDVNDDGVINFNDYLDLYYYYYDLADRPASVPDFNSNGTFDESDVNDYYTYIFESEAGSEVAMYYNYDLDNNGIIEYADQAWVDYYAGLKDTSDNYYAYMDKDDNGTIEDFDVAWFSAAYAQSGDLDWDHAFKRSLTVWENGYFPYSLNLHDTNLNLGECALYVGDCMSFTTDIPEFWSNGEGAYLNINGGMLYVENNLVFRTTSPDGWNGNAGQIMNLNGGEVYIYGDFNFGQANCYDTILMTNEADYFEIGGNWNYITLTDMEGKWTAGQIAFLGPIWQVNEASGPKSIYSSGTHSIYFYYEGGRQTILWDNCQTYINEEDGTLNTQRTFNFDYEDGLIFPEGYTEDLYWFRPWFRPYDEPDYTLYRKGWEMGDGVHIATGNYTKTFTDLSIESPGVQSDFIRTYNSTSDEEGSFGIGWDFNIDVSKIVIPAEGYYQVVLPDGSNTTFKDDGNGGFECLNAHSTMTKSGSEYTVTNAAQSQYHFNTDGELDWVKDAEGNILTISAISNNQRTVTDSTGRTYMIIYNGNSEHSRVTEIKDTAANRSVVYEYNSDYQLISATSVSGGTETYEYDGNGRLCKITNCYNEVTDQIVYNDNGSVNWLTNASGLKQVYTYDKAQKQTGLKEYDGDTLVKWYSSDQRGNQLTAAFSV